MESNENMKTTRRTAKIIQVTYLASVFIFIIALIYIQRNSPLYPALLDNAVLNIVTTVLGVIGIINIAIGYFLPRWLINRSKQKGDLPRHVLEAYIVRCAFFEAVAIYGLVLGILGSKWEIILPFFFIAAVAMILTFPTEGRWQKMLEP